MHAGVLLIVHYDFVPKVVTHRRPIRDTHLAAAFCDPALCPDVTLPLDDIPHSTNHALQNIRLRARNTNRSGEGHKSTIFVLGCHPNTSSYNSSYSELYKSPGTDPSPSRGG